MPALSIGLGHQHPGLMLAAIPEVKLLLVQNEPDNRLTVVADPAMLTINVTEPAALAGTFEADPRDLTRGPINLVPPVILPPFQTGSPLFLTVGLWVYDAAFGVPQVSYSWSEGGTEYPEMDAVSFTPTAVGATVHVRETLTQVGDRVSSVQSASISTT